MKRAQAIQTVLMTSNSIPGWEEADTSFILSPMEDYEPITFERFSSILADAGLVDEEMDDEPGMVWLDTKVE